MLRPGAGWSRLRAEEQQAHLRALAADMAAQATPALGARFRAARLRPLLARYAAKARADGMALRARVVTRRFEPTLAGYFGGDWLAFLEYLGARPHPDEQTATALPEARLYLGADRLAAPTPVGIDEAQLRLMLRAFYGDADGASPVARRLAVLRRYWAVFDTLHAAQRPGLPPLWGLVAEGADVPRPDDTWSLYQDGLYERAVPADLLRDIEECWGTAVLPAHPGRIVGALSAHATLAEAFGPGLRFWHGCALTAWFLCEGPYSRTDMAGLAEYHRAELAALAELGTPADPALFRQLGAPVPLREETTDVASDWGTLRMTMMTSFGQRRPGFERLRDIITAARRVGGAAPGGVPPCARGAGCRRGGAALPDAGLSNAGSNRPRPSSSHAMPRRSRTAGSAATSTPCIGRSARSQSSNQCITAQCPAIVARACVRSIACSAGRSRAMQSAWWSTAMRPDSRSGCRRIANCPTWPDGVSSTSSWKKGSGIRPI